MSDQVEVVSSLRVTHRRIYIYLKWPYQSSNVYIREVIAYQWLLWSHWLFLFFFDFALFFSHFFFVIIRQDLWFDFIRKILNRKIQYRVITYFSAKTMKYNRKNYKNEKMYWFLINRNTKICNCHIRQVFCLLSPASQFYDELMALRNAIEMSAEVVCSSHYLFTIKVCSF